MMSRISAEVSESLRPSVHSRMAASGVRWVLFVPSEFLTFRDAVSNCLSRLKALVRGRRLVFCGWLRSQSDFRILWRDYYLLERELPVGELTGFLLRLNSQNFP